MNKKNTPEIDFVIAWVDGSDPAWLEERNRYRCETGDARATRYRDWGLLPYWFRAVEKYAPWVRKIHFITWGHLPEWLDTTNPKLNIVKHTDYIPAEYLPTFQSHTIELNMHRIEGLAEHFVYFNDDMFLTREVTPEYFFRNGLPCDCFSLQSINFRPNSIGWIYGSNISVINKNFSMRPTLKKHWKKVFDPRNGVKKVIRTALHAICHPWFPGLFYSHTAAIYLKSTLETLWDREFQILDETCRCRFREKTNVSHVVFKNWQLVTGQFSPASAKTCRVYHLRKKQTASACRDIRNKTYASFCINDSGKFDDIETVADQFKAAFEDVLPQKCSFEKRGKEGTV